MCFKYSVSHTDSINAYGQLDYETTADIGKTTCLIFISGYPDPVIAVKSYRPAPRATLTSHCG